MSQVSWNTRDLLLYAVGIGAQKDDLALAYGELINMYAFIAFNIDGRMLFQNLVSISYFASPEHIIEHPSDRNFAPFPTYPVVLPFKGASVASRSMGSSDRERIQVIAKM